MVSFVDVGITGLCGSDDNLLFDTCGALLDFYTLYKTRLATSLILVQMGQVRCLSACPQKADADGVVTCKN